jgi:hypothetical protein
MTVDADDTSSGLADAEAALDDAIAENDVGAINKWMKTIERLHAKQGVASGGSSPKKMTKDEEAAAIEELLGRIGGDVVSDTAAAAAAEAAVEGVGESGAGEGGPSLSTKAAVDDLLEVLGEDEDAEGGSWDKGEEEGEEEEGVYLVDDDALADDDWRKNVGTGWEVDDEAQDEGSGVCV